MTPVGMPGTTMTEGRGRNGKGVSEPSRTSGFQGPVGAKPAFARVCSAKNNVGPIPTPSPINSGRGLLATRPYDVCEHGHAYSHPIAHLVAND
jgi:hypothetical protein